MSCHLSRALLLLLGSLPSLAGTPLEGLVLPFRQVELPAPVTSRIVELKVKEGEAVKAGQPLAQLYGRPEELELQRAKALLERRELRAKGARKLVADKVIAEAEALDSRFELESARLQYEAAAEQVKLHTLFAPIDGVVVEVRRELGEAVSASQPVFRILDLSRVLVQCMVKPEEVARLAPGQKARVRVPQLPGAPVFPGEVVLVDPCAGSDGLFRARVLVENAERRIRSGLRALVDLPEAP